MAKNIFSLAFLDLETTGLPSEENNKTRITEICITVVESDHLKSGVYPRVANKLNLCVNPLKIIHPQSTQITGLGNDLLENQTSFDHGVVDIINSFLKLHKEPICLVAHNGYKFDFPILKAEMNKLGVPFDPDILCVDSLPCFRELHSMKERYSSSKQAVEEPETNIHKNIDQTDSSGSGIPKKIEFSSDAMREFDDGLDDILCDAVDQFENSMKRRNIQKILETTPKKQIMRDQYSSFTHSNKPRVSFKLGDIYKRVTLNEPKDSHRAEGDVDLLIQCAAAYGEQFIEWVNENARKFSDIHPMTPGKPIGM